MSANYFSFKQVWSFMYKRWVIIFLFVSCFFVFLSCTHEVTENDIIVPLEVKDLEIQESSDCIILTWVNPIDTRFDGTEVTVFPSVLNYENPIILDKSIVEFEIQGLPRGIEYTFTVKSIDINKNYSVGVKSNIIIEAINDKIAPANVTNILGVNKDSSVLLTWIDAIESDIYGYEVSWNQDIAINRNIPNLPVVLGSMIIPQGNGGCYINGLVNGTTYVFSVKSVDINGNKSDGVFIEITPMAIVSSEPMVLSLVPSTMEGTDNDVVVTVSIVTASSINKVVYLAGISTSASFLLSNDSAIDITGALSFTVTKNGTYTVAAIDSSGRREINYISVSNIDKETLGSVMNAFATYSYKEKKVSVFWDDPENISLKNIKVDYSTDDEECIAYVEKGVQYFSFIVPEENLVDTKYKIRLTAISFSDNFSDTVETSVTTNLIPAISSIILNRNHLSNSNDDRNIDVIIKGNNFDQIKSQPDTTFFIQVVNNDDEIIFTHPAFVDTEKNTAEVNIAAPVTNSEYKVQVVLCGMVVENPVAEFVISSPLSVSDIVLSESSISIDNANSETLISAKILGTNLDEDGVLSIQLYDSLGNSYGDAITINNQDWSFNIKEFVQDFHVPLKEDMYSVKILFNGVIKQSVSLHVYGTPQASSFSIPNAGISCAGDSIEAKIYGKNFLSPDFNLDSFSFSCENSLITENAKLSVINDCCLAVKLIIPFEANEYSIVISDGDKSINGIFCVKDYSAYSIGTIVYKDGTISLDNDELKTAIGIIAGYNTYGAAICIGINQSSIKLRWAASMSVGYKTEFKFLQSSLDSSEYEISNSMSFTGDVDGSDNWKMIFYEDIEGYNVAVDCYPGFSFADSYSFTNNLLGTEYEDGWFIPCVFELCEIYKNIDTVNKAFVKVSGEELEGSYLTSSQSTSKYYYVWHVDFTKGKVSECSKVLLANALVIRIL